MNQILTAQEVAIVSLAVDLVLIAAFWAFIHWRKVRKTRKVEGDKMYNRILEDILRQRGRYMFYLQRKLQRKNIEYLSEIDYSEFTDEVPSMILRDIDGPQAGV